jgi:hypothetical protein
MCLDINKDQEENERNLNKWFGSRTKFAYVYKILRKNKSEDFYRSATYDRFIWDFSRQKVFEVDRSSKPTKMEILTGLIGEGFHVYTSKISTIERTSGVVVKFRVKREDLVAVNIFNKEAVCKKLNFVKVIED